MEVWVSVIAADEQGGGNWVFAESPTGWFGHCFWYHGFQIPLSSPLGNVNYLIFLYKCIFC